MILDLPPPVRTQIGKLSPTAMKRRDSRFGVSAPLYCKGSPTLKQKTAVSGYPAIVQLHTESSPWYHSHCFSFDLRPKRSNNIPVLIETALHAE